MYSKSLICGAVAGLMLGVAGLPVQASEAINAQHLKTIETARDLVAYGMENDDSMSLIQAARMYNSVGLFEGKSASREGGTIAADVGSTAEKMSDVLALSVESVLNKAEEFAGDNEMLMGLIEDARAEQSRGAGGLVYVEALAAGETQEFTVNYEMDKIAALYVESDIGSAMNVSVSDASGASICDTPVPVEYTRCEWMADGTGEVSVSIENLADEVQYFVFLTN